MLKKTLGAILFLMSSSYSFANVVMGIQGQELSTKIDGHDVTLGVINSSLGFEVPVLDDFYLIPEFRFGANKQSGKYSVDGSLKTYNYKVALNYSLTLSIRAQYEFEHFYFFAAPAYTDIKLSYVDFSGEIDKSNSGIYAGVGYKFKDYILFELAYDKFGYSNSIGLGFRLEFKGLRENWK